MCSAIVHEIACPVCSEWTKEGIVIHDEDTPCLDHPLLNELEAKQWGFWTGKDD